MPRPTVYVCGGSDCRKARRDHACLLASLEGVADVRSARCQKICDGPVAGVEVDGTLEWFGRIDGGKVRDELITVAEGGAPGKRLRKRRDADRQGKLRR